MVRAWLRIAALALLVAGLAPAPPARAQADSCRWAHDGECDEARFGGTGACAAGTDATDCRAAAEGIARLMAAMPADLRARLGDDSCRWAFDLECDDAALGGTGACREGTDATDCRAMATGGDDSCQFAHDGECDEPGIGTGVCTSGTDRTDCAAVAFLRNRSNDCEFAMNGICDEPGTGTGRCRANTDTNDCIGRDRPATVRDHFFGHDDRVVFRPDAMPWRAVGLIQTSDGGSCTGALVAPRLVATAAHCMLAEDGRTPVKALVFRAGAWGGDEIARGYVVAQQIAPDYSPDTRPPGQGNGTDWALLTLDRDLGLTAGLLRPHVLGKAELDRLSRGERLTVSQAGYSWDTGSWLSGHSDCAILTAYPDGSFIHDCDTTRGDSGSPIVMQVAGAWRLVAVDSQFFTPQPPYPAFSSAHLAVDTRAFAAALRAAGALD